MNNISLEYSKPTAVCCSRNGSLIIVDNPQNALRSIFGTTFSVHTEVWIIQSNGGNFMERDDIVDAFPQCCEHPKLNSIHSHCTWVKADIVSQTLGE